MLVRIVAGAGGFHRPRAGAAPRMARATPLRAALVRRRARGGAGRSANFDAAGLGLARGALTGANLIAPLGLAALALAAGWALAAPRPARGDA